MFMNEERESGRKRGREEEREKKGREEKGKGGKERERPAPPATSCHKRSLQTVKRGLDEKGR